MAKWIARAGALIGVLVTGCGSQGYTPIAAGPNRSPLSTRPSGSIKCGRAPVYGPALAAAGSSVVRLPAAPDGIAATPDGGHAFVALQSGPPRIAVIQRARLVRTVPVPAYASGLRVTPDGRYVLAAAGRGAVVLGVRAATSGAAGAVVGSLEAPASVAGTGPGAAEVAVSPDSRYAFVTLEGAGLIAVFDLSRGFGPRAYIGAVPVGAGALGLAASPDGRWLYEVSESDRARGSRRPGALNVISVSRAVRAPRSAVVGAAPVPCAPVRVAVSPDGATVWVTARDGDQLLGFSTSALRTHPARALLSATSVGSAPLGLAVLNAGRAVVVADSNLARSAGSHSAISVVDTSTASHSVLTGWVPAGKLADAIAAPASGGSAFVTSSSGRTVEVLPVTSLR